MKLKKGSAAAKAYMAKIRAKRKKVTKVGSILDKVKRARTAAKKKTAYSVIDKTIASATKSEKPALKKAKKLIEQTYIGAVKKAAKKVSSIHKDTASHNVRISVISGIDLHSNPQAWANAWMTAVKHKGVFIDVLKIKDKKYYVPNIRPHVYFSTLSQAKKYISRKAIK